MRFILVWLAAWFSLGIFVSSLVKLGFMVWLFFALASAIMCFIFFKKQLLFVISAGCAFFCWEPRF